MEDSNGFLHDFYQVELLLLLLLLWNVIILQFIERKR